ncbi:MAG: Calx-beta domain-containing protein [Micromonosporaceae bacterium]
MNTITSRLFAGIAALVAAVSLAVVVPAPSGASAACIRTVLIEPQSSFAEGGGGLTFRVYSSGCAAAGTVSYQAAAGSAQTPGDFTLPPGLIRLPAGDLRPRSITAQVVADTVHEADVEDFTVRLVGPSADVRVAAATGHGRILDDDDLDLTAVTDDVICVREYIPENIDCEPEAKPNFAYGPPVTLHWSTVDGTARAGVDFVGVTDQVVTIPAGALRVTVPVELLAPLPGKPRRWFYVQIFNPSTGTIADPVAVVTLEAS